MAAVVYPEYFSRMRARAKDTAPRRANVRATATIGSVCGARVVRQRRVIVMCAIVTAGQRAGVYIRLDEIDATLFNYCVFDGAGRCTCVGKTVVVGGAKTNKFRRQSRKNRHRCCVRTSHALW